MSPLRPTLLLVEDEPGARHALGRALARGGYDVSEAGDVESALAALARSPLPTVAVIDVVLGRNDRGGLDVLAALRRASTKVPAVIITAFADVARVKMALNLGASHLLEKPFRAVDLLPVLAELTTSSPEPAQTAARAFEAAGLTPREAEIAVLVLKGLPSPEIARLLAISDKTVRQHLSSVYEKLGVHSRGELSHLLFPV